MKDQKELENVEYLKYFCSEIANCARYTREIKSKIATEKAKFSSKLFLILRKKLVKCYIWTIASCGAETWTLREADQEYLESSEAYCLRRME
jgi:hypothetical protein